MTIISINLDDEDVKRLDELAGPRQRSAWIRNVITERYANLLKARAFDQRVRRSIANGRKATTPRKKTA